MKLLVNISLLFFLVTTLVSCKPKEVLVIPIANTSPIVWKKAFEITRSAGTPHYYNGTLIVGHQAKEKHNFLVYCLDPSNGDSIWQTRIVTPFEFSPTSDENSIVYQDKIIFSTRKRMFVLNADNGEILWKYEDPYNYVGITVIDGYIYLADNIDNITSTMYRFDINTGVKEKVFTIDKAEYGSNYSPNLNVPVKWNHPNGDEILVLQNRTYGWDTDGKPKMDILAWNLTADSMLWYKERLDGHSSSRKPAISGDKVYFYGDQHAYCINALTGETIWKYFIGEGIGNTFYTANILIIDNKLVVKPDSRQMHVVDKETGERIWFNKETRASPRMLSVHKDTIWFSSGWVLGIDANTGEKLIEWDNNGRGSWSNAVAHHPTNGYIYTSDASYFYCLNPKYMK